MANPSIRYGSMTNGSRFRLQSVGRANRNRHHTSGGLDATVQFFVTWNGGDVRGVGLVVVEAPLCVYAAWYHPRVIRVQRGQRSANWT